MDTPKCADCKFYDELGHVVGRCKRYPPTVYSCDEYNSTNVISPMVSKDDWCGEFVPKYLPVIIPEGFHPIFIVKENH